MAGSPPPPHGGMPPPGWYQDPANPTYQRWWDGAGWSAHIHPPYAPPPPRQPSGVGQGFGIGVGIILALILIPIAFLAGCGLLVAGSQSAPLVHAACTSARVLGRHHCLQAGQYCTHSSAANADYHRYGYHCGRRDSAGRYHLVRYAPRPRHHTQPKPRCRLGHLPDRHCTPGAVFSGATVDRICTPGYASSVRDVSSATKAKVYRRYGVRRHRAGHWEVDHLVPLELGGSNSIRNLWPESAHRPGFHQKDELENLFHRRVCDGDASLHVAQKVFKRDWLREYKAYRDAGQLK